jgi:pyridoxal phosphate enzyme (YggS family)
MGIVNFDVELINRRDNLCSKLEHLASLYPAAEPRLLLAVSKYADIESMRMLYEAGQRDFAENYWQSAIKKIAMLSDLNIIWHYIGELQSNKCQKIAKCFNWVHSLTKPKHALLLAQGRHGLPALQICLQVNLSRDSSRNGVLPENLFMLAQAVLAYPELSLRGLMLLPKPDEAGDFERLAQLRDQLAAQLNRALPTLSMGMSGDYVQAVAAGATMIRIGSALFQ